MKDDNKPNKEQLKLEATMLPEAQEELDNKDKIEGTKKDEFPRVPHGPEHVYF